MNPNCTPGAVKWKKGSERMEAVVLLGGFLLVAAAGLPLMGRIDRFLERGGISRYWDAEDERGAALGRKDGGKRRFPQMHSAAGEPIRHGKGRQHG